MLRVTPQTPKNLLMKFDVFVLRQQPLNYLRRFNLALAQKLACPAPVKT
jgi:hypothetical protein